MVIQTYTTIDGDFEWIRQPKYACWKPKAYHCEGDMSHYASKNDGILGT